MPAFVHSCSPVASLHMYRSVGRPLWQDKAGCVCVCLCVTREARTACPTQTLASDRHTLGPLHLRRGELPQVWDHNWGDPTS